MYMVNALPQVEHGSFTKRLVKWCFTAMNGNYYYILCNCRGCWEVDLFWKPKEEKIVGFICRSMAFNTKPKSWQEDHAVYVVGPERYCICVLSKELISHKRKRFGLFLLHWWVFFLPIKLNKLKILFFYIFYSLPYSITNYLHDIIT